MNIPSLQQMRETFYRNTGLKPIKPIRDVIIPVRRNEMNGPKQFPPNTAIDQPHSDDTVEDEDEEMKRMMKMMKMMKMKKKGEEAEDKTAHAMQILATVCHERLGLMAREMEAAHALLSLKSGRGEEKEREEKKKGKGKGKRKRELTEKARERERELEGGRKGKGTKQVRWADGSLEGLY